MDNRKRIFPLMILLIAALLLTGCGEKRVDSPTAPPQTMESIPPAEETEVVVMTVPAEPETEPETEPVTEPATEPETEPATEPVTEPVEETMAEETQETEPLMVVIPREAEYVPVSKYLPDVVVDLRYAGTDNFTGTVIYDFTEAYLRYGTVMKLEKVCQELAQKGLYLKIWDAFRPTSAQFKLWEVCPDSRYVADPNKGYSSHSRGNAVDVTLVTADGEELEMPTAFDDFTELADRDYSDCTEAARENAKLLQSVMEKHGFQGYWGEWWHFSDSVKYEADDFFTPRDFSVWFADCKEFITLRRYADAQSEALLRIPADDEFVVMGFKRQFALVEYQGVRGYVLRKYIQPVETE